MRMAYALCAAWLAAAPHAAAQSTDSTWRDHLRAAGRAESRQEWSDMRAQLLAARRLIGALPTIDYGLAVAESRLGNGEHAVEWLAVFASMGLWRDAAHDPDLAAARAQPGFAAVIARLDANRQPVTNGTDAFTLPDPDLIAEDIAYDSTTHRFFVSSIRERKIVVIDSTGRVSDFTTPGTGGVWGMMALAADPARGTLWATTAALPAVPGVRGDTGHSALIAYDLRTAVLQRRYDAPGRGPHVLGDMTLAPDGTVFVSDAAAGAVYVLAPGADSLAVIAQPGTFLSPQTPALDASARLLFVPDYARGIAAIDLATLRVRWLPHPGDIVLTGIDGLYRVGHDFIALQNGTTPNRVMRFLLDDAMSRVFGAEVIERGTPPLDDPTHGVRVGGDLYFIARSGWSRVADDGTMRPGGPADRPLVRRVSLLAP